MIFKNIIPVIDIQQAFFVNTLIGMKQKITSLQKPHKQFASNPNLTIKAEKKLLYLREARGSFITFS